jgi:HSP20 family protein
MSLIRWSPRHELESFARDPFFRRFLDALDDFEPLAERNWYPRLDLLEEKDRLVAQVELPGIDPKNVSIDLQGGVLTIQGERQVAKESENRKVLRSEQVYGSFTRTIQLPYRVQSDKVKAEFKNGILTILLPKAEEHVGRQIPVEVTG